MDNIGGLGGGGGKQRPLCPLDIEIWKVDTKSGQSGQKIIAILKSRVI